MAPNAPKLKSSEVVTTEIKFDAEISAADIRAAFDLPVDAEIVFDVPGGADWSNCALDISDHPIRVSWRRVTVATN